MLADYLIWTMAGSSVFAVLLAGSKFARRATGIQRVLRWTLVGGLAAFCSYFLIVLGGVVGELKEMGRWEVCNTNLKQVSVGIGMYAVDWNDSLPRADRWMDLTEGYVKNREAFTCSVVKRYGYAWNSKVGGAKQASLPEPEKLPVVYDSTEFARNANDPLTSLPSPPRHQHNNIVFADGHVGLDRRKPNP